jgi:hypothetical protein
MLFYSGSLDLIHCSYQMKKVYLKISGKCIDFTCLKKRSFFFYTLDTWNEKNDYSVPELSSTLFLGISLRIITVLP